MKEDFIPIPRKNLIKLLNSGNKEEICNILGISENYLIYKDSDFEYDIDEFGKSYNLSTEKVLSLKLFHHDLSRDEIYFSAMLRRTEYFANVKDWQAGYPTIQLEENLNNETIYGGHEFLEMRVNIPVDQLESRGITFK